LIAPSAREEVEEEPNASPGRRRLLLLLLALTFLRGIVYLAIAPPWQHYDEPTHFEYVRLLAETGRLPAADDYDVGMRQEIASSMQAAGFWAGTAPLPIGFWSDEPAWLGTSELDHPQLYYAVLAIPQLLVAHQSVETQLYLARFVSVLLNLLVVASAYWLVAELLPHRRLLPLAVAAFVALLPPFTDLMSAVNNDAGAVAAATLLLLACVRMVRRGPSPKRALAIVLLAAACVATKSTSGGVAVVSLFALALGDDPKRQRRWLWIGLAVLLPVGLVSILTWSTSAAHWISDDNPGAADRISMDSVLGDSAFVLSRSDSQQARVIFQELGRSEGARLRGHTVTFGAWLKADEGSEGLVVLNLYDGLENHWHRLQATTEWRFHTLSATIDPDAPGVAYYALIPDREDGAQRVFLDGLVLVDAAIAPGDSPVFDSDQAAKAMWGEQQFTNLVKNGSAERSWPSVRSWLADLVPFGQPLPTILHSLLDWSRTGWVYIPGIRLLLDSFWGTFGWNHLALPSPILLALKLLALVAVLGLGLGLLRWVRGGRKDVALRWQAWGILAGAALFSWGSTILRVHPVFLTRNAFWPVARYSAVVIVPTALALCLGLAELIPRVVSRKAAWIGLLGMATLDAVALITVMVPYYYG
jgi:hypothetical protein